MSKSTQQKRALAKSHSFSRQDVLGGVRAAIGNAQSGRGGAKGISYGINRYRETLSVTQIKHVVTELSAHPAYKKVVWPSPFPSTWREFALRGFDTYVGFAEEIEWCSRSLLVYHEQISAFIRHRDQFDTLLIQGKVRECDILLTEVQQSFGLSVWLAEARLSLFQIENRNQEYREFLRSISGDPEVPGVIRWLISWIAFKYEENTSYDQLRRTLSAFGPENSGLVYILKLLYGDFVHLDEDAAGQAMSFADTLPVFDRFILFHRVVNAVIASNPESGDIRSSVISSLTPIFKRIEEPSLRRTLLASGADIELALPSAEFEAALESYTAGQLAMAYSASQDELTANPTNIANLDLIARSSRHRSAPLSDPLLEPHSLLSDVQQSLIEMYAFGPRALDSRRKLQKIGLVYASRKWAFPVQMLTAPRATQLIADGDAERLCYNALQCPYEHPSLAASLKHVMRPDRYLDAFKGRVPFTCKLIGAAYGDRPDPVLQISALNLPANRAARFIAIGMQQRNQLSEAILVLTKGYEEALSQREGYEAGQPLVDLLLEIGQLDRCAEIASELFLSSSYFASVLPVSELLSSIVEAQEEGLPNGARGNLSVATVADMYARYVAPDKEVARSDAYKDFLRANGVRKASELDVKSARYPSAELIYFLRYVCVPEVTDQSLALPSTNAVEDERVAVLLLLTELTPESDRETQLSFLEELREIRTRQVVRDTNNRLEQSKIFVNVEGIKKRVEASIRDNWGRYRILSLLPSQGDPIEEIMKLLGRHTGNKVITLSMTMPETEKGKLFAQMVAEIRELFVESKEFGLDANLSANIRHGYVLREIRSPLLAQNLVTNRPTEDEPYDRDSYWSDRLSYLDVAEREHLANALAEFSAEIDSKIESLNSRKLRINKAASPEGLFMYPLTATRLSYLEQKSANFDKHDDFINFVIDYLWTATEANLATARNYLQSYALQEFSEALDKLEAKLAEVATPWKITGLRSALTLARPEIQAAIGRVASWFTLSTEVEHPDYEASTAYQAGMETIKSYASNLVFNSTLKCAEEVILRGRTLPFIGRIIFIILDNIVEHAGYKGGSINVNCTIELKNGYLAFDISNDLDAAVDMDRVEERVADVNQAYGTEKATQFISVEKRSGYPKIWKILTHDLQVDHFLKVSSDRITRTFSVEIMLAAQGVVR